MAVDAMLSARLIAGKKLLRRVLISVSPQFVCFPSHEPDGRHSLPVQAAITGSILHLIRQSGNRSRKLPRHRYQYGRIRAVEHHRHQRHRQRKGAAGHTLETLGSTFDLISLGKVSHPMVRIDAKGSPRDPDRQETSVLEAKYAPAGHNSKMWAGADPATSERRWGSFVSA